MSAGLVGASESSGDPNQRAMVCRSAVLAGLQENSRLFFVDIQVAFYLKYVL